MHCSDLRVQASKGRGCGTFGKRQTPKSYTVCTFEVLKLFFMIVESVLGLGFRGLGFRGLGLSGFRAYLFWYGSFNKNRLGRAYIGAPCYDLLK